MRVNRLLPLLILLSLSLDAQSSFDWLPTRNALITDTLQIVWPEPAPTISQAHKQNILDSRNVDPGILDIRQTEKFRVIPVDQILVLPDALPNLLTEKLDSTDGLEGGRFHFLQTTLWVDGKPFLAKGPRLNAYTTLYDSLEQPVRDWMWEIRIKPEKKEADSLWLGRILDSLLTRQARELKAHPQPVPFYPYAFRRQLLVWTDQIIFRDGFALNAHLTLDFPPDRLKSWVRGSPGIYYRRGRHHESIAMGGIDQHWYHRVNTLFLLTASGTVRFGFNNYDRNQYAHLEIQNLFFFQLAAQVSLELRPRDYRGPFGALGFYQSVHILPDVLPRYEPGLVLSLGVLLP